MLQSDDQNFISSSKDIATGDRRCWTDYKNNNFLAVDDIELGILLTKTISSINFYGAFFNSTL